MYESFDDLPQYVYEDARTIHEACQRGLRESKNGPMLGYRKKQPDGTEPYVWLSYKEVIELSYDLTYGFMDLGLNRGQETFIGIYTKNRPEWMITELAACNNRNVLIPLYATLGPESCVYIINETAMKLIACDTEDKAESLLENKERCPSLKYLIIVEDFSEEFVKKAASMGVEVYKFVDIEKRGRDRKSRPTLQDVLFSFLPLAHMFERFIEIVAFQVGMRVGYFRGDVRKLAEDIKELRPTVVILVPRVLNRVYDKVMSEVENSFLKKTLFDIAIAYKSREYQRGIVRSDSFVDKLVFKKVQDGLGGRLKLMITGSAPVSDNVMKFARASLGCIVIEGYGQTECVGAASLCAEADSVFGHVGMPIPCVAIKLFDVPELGYFAKDQTGEVCVRGHSVFKGYYKNEQLTKEVFDEEGWLHTGDIGRWTSTGTLKIIDRKKHIFKLAQGEYIAPEHIESVYARCKYVAQSFVYGESLKTYLIGIVVPNFEVLQGSIAEKLGLKGLSNEELCKKPSAKETILEEMTATGKKAGLYSFQQVKDIYLCPELFSIENDLLTPTMKSKRPKLKEHFAAQIEQMYSKLR